MRKLIVSLLLLIGITHLVYTQEAEKKIFKSEDNKLYVNKDLGVYLWLSTSPEPGSEKVRLISDSSARYSNPMYFDTEGYNTVRSPSRVDTVTKQVVYPIEDIIFEVYADGLAPVSRSIYHSSSSKVIGGKKFYGNDLKVELSSRDAVSGIHLLSYSLNESAFLKYEAAISGFIEGENTLKYSADDKVGNTEQAKEDIFYIDTTAPKTSYNIEGGKTEKYVSARSKIVLSSSDKLAGVSAIYYKINNGQYKKYYTPISASVLSNSPGTISFYAVDLVGNKEKLQSIGGKESGTEDGNSSVIAGDVMFEFYVDKDAPNIHLELEGDQFASKYTYISTRSRITINAVDEKAGVEKVWYSINSTNIDQEYKEPISLEKSGLHYIRTKAKDYVGNISSVTTKAYYCDTEPPKLNFAVGNPKFSSRDTLFISSKTELVISGSDALSGIGTILYAIDEGEKIEYSESFKLKKKGSHSIRYLAKDKVNNETAEIVFKAYVDNVAPVIHYHFSVESIGNKTVRDEPYTIYPTNAMLYIAATDARSGGEKIEYTINGKPAQSANPLKGLAPGNYHIIVKAFDVLDNVSTREIKFSIEK